MKFSPTAAAKHLFEAIIAGRKNTDRLRSNYRIGPGRQSVLNNGLRGHRYDKPPVRPWHLHPVALSGDGRRPAGTYRGPRRDVYFGRV